MVNILKMLISKNWRFFRMEKIDYEVDDFMNYCDYKNLSKKSMKSYEQTLRLFIRYLKDECNITNTAQVKEQTIE